MLALGCLGAAVFVIVGGSALSASTPTAATTTDPTLVRVKPPELPGLREEAAQSPDTNSPYSVWAGPGCSTGDYQEEGRFENGDAAWYTVSFGGHQDSSCDGRFAAIPMSGSPDDDGPSTATWWWQLGPGYETCALSVYVPDSGRPQDTAGDPTVYKVLADPTDEGSAYGVFGVRQTTHRGSLVRVGEYHVKGDSFAVRLLDRGRDWGTPDRLGAHHAAAQMKLDCT